jgi:hypothetical protein
MTSILVDAFCFACTRVPPLALFSTASIFSALAPRASRFYDVTPRLLALLRRSPFFCFTQDFVLLDVTDADVCQIIRECVSIKSLRIWSSKVTGSFINDAILSGSGGLITRTLEDLDCHLMGNPGDHLGDRFVPLLLPTSSPMTPAFVCSMVSRLLWGSWQPIFGHSSRHQLLQSSLDALEGRRDNLWEPALMFAAYLLDPEWDQETVIDASVVRRCVAAVEELIDADEYVALLAVELLTRLLERHAELVVPLLLRESDALRGVLMLCDRYIERIKRGERVAAFTACEKAERLPLRVIDIALQQVVVTAPTVDVLQVLSYRDGDRVRTVLDVIVAYRSCPKVTARNEDPFRATIVADASGRELFELFEYYATGFLVRLWPRPFNVDGSPANQFVRSAIELQVMDAFAPCDTILSLDPAAVMQDAKKLGEVNHLFFAVLVGVRNAFLCVDKGEVQPTDIYDRANAHLSVEQRALARVRLFNWIMAIRRRGGCECDAPSRAGTQTRTFADILVALLRARLRFERLSGHRSTLSNENDSVVHVCASVVGHVVWFLSMAFADCVLLLDAARTRDDAEDKQEAADDIVSSIDHATSGRRRRRPHDDVQQQPQPAPAAEERAFWAATATEGLERTAAILRRPDVIDGLVSTSTGQEVSHACKVLLDFAVEQGFVSSGDLAASRSAVAERLKRRLRKRGSGH